jgi:lysozyme
MSSIVPPSRPRATREIVVAAALREWKKEGHTTPLPDFFVFGVRGYYRDTMGKPGKNDRGIYDDAFFILAPECFVAFNGNVDPSRFKPGVATLCDGFHPYKPGNHGITRPGGGYPAFRPATKNEELPVQRDGVRVPWPGVAINIHRGGENGTSSEGCQTVPPSQWDAFHALVISEFRKTGLSSFWYGLTTGPIV